MQLKQGTTIANRYVIADVLGKGGMAIVYRARDIKLDRDVTLKIMREEFVKDDEFINRFNVEAKACAKLSHQNIVNVYDVGKFGEIYFIVMEYIEGVTLKDIINRRGTFTNEEILGVSIQIAQALEVAHRNGIVHRDIKPQNILINAKGDVKVTDFGIARAVNANTATTGNNTMGSVHYFSPEQARGTNITEKSDIYSLGITMYEMATGKVPFDDETVVAIALKHISEPLPKIAEKNPNVNGKVIEIIEKAAEKITTLRYENIENMNNELKRALITLGKAEEKTTSEEVVVPQFSQVEAHTLKLSDDDITEIRTKAMTAFFDNGEMEEINMLSMNQDDDNRKRKRKREINLYEEEKEKDTSGKKMMIAGVICAILLSFVVALGVFSYLRGSTELVDVPDLVGMTIEEAREEVKPYKLSIEEDSQRFDDEYEAGVIVEQDYISGTDKIKVGGTITVITSSGPKEETVPDVVGDDVETAFSKLEEKGFKAEYKYEFYDDAEINTVQKQTPSAGAQGASGDTVTLYICKGEKSTTTFVPSVVGKTEAKAKSEIEEAGLTYGGTSYDYSEEYKEGVVFAQSPKSAQEVQDGSNVSLFVSKGKKPETVPTTDTTEDKETTEPTEKPKTDNTTTTTAPKSSSKTFTVNAIDGLEPTDKVSVKFVKISGDGSASVAYENTVNASDLPLNVSVEGTGEERIQLSTKVNDGAYTLQADTKVNFGE